MIIPRVPHFWSRGDASLTGGGAYCPGLQFWFDVVWSKKVRYGALHLKRNSSHPGHVHINSLEFIVIIIQLAAIKTRLASLPPGSSSVYFPHGKPTIPVWLGETDNTVSRAWENRATAKTPTGQGLVGVYAELLRTTAVHTQCDHIPGKDNTIADDISRADFSLPFQTRLPQLYHKHRCLNHLDYFQISPQFQQLLSSRLFCKQSLEQCVLPTVLGQFVPECSTISGSVAI